MSVIDVGPTRRLPVRDEEGVYHLGWYPLALSSELKGEALVGRDFLGGRVVLHRDGTGKAIVQSAYCPHLGADLSTGELVDGQIRCAFHQWSFDATGRCTRIPSELKIPPEARITTFPSAEAWGIVWGFSGPTPLFELPRVPGVKESELAYRAQMHGVSPFDPWLPTANGVDFQHLCGLHGVPGVTGPDTIDVREHSMEYVFNLGRAVIRGLIVGTNTFALYRNDNGDEAFRMWSATPLRHGESLAFSVTGTRNTHPRSDEERRSLDRRLDGLAAEMVRLREEDDRVLIPMRFRQGVLVSADRHLARYFKYVREFPTVELVDAQ